MRPHAGGTHVYLTFSHVYLNFCALCRLWYTPSSSRWLLELR